MRKLAAPVVIAVMFAASGCSKQASNETMPDSHDHSTHQH